MTAEVIYILCAATSLFCFVLLFRGFLRTRAALLLWSAVAFLAFTVTNILLVLDLIFLPRIDLSLYRNAVTLFGVALLIYGLIVNS